MAHFARIVNNIVVEVVVVDNSKIIDSYGNESEQKGIDFLHYLFGTDNKWVQTSYNASFRKNYAGIGYSWDSERNAFIPPKPYPSWSLDENTCLWVPPVAMPSGGLYRWNEQQQNWISVG